MNAWLANLHRLALRWWQARRPVPEPVTRDTLFRTWAQLHDARPGSPAEQAAWQTLTTADAERREGRY